MGELGYLLRNSQPWNTIRLFALPTPSGASTKQDRVLDHFRLRDSARIRHGLVNPNTKQRDVLGALLTDMPMDEYPGKGTDRLSATDAASLADAFVTSRSVNFTNVSDVGSHTNYFGHSVLSGRSPFEVEAILRNTSELLATRQNLFTILLASESISRASDRRVWVSRDVPLTLGPAAHGWFTTVEADQRAVAVVWRDPFPDPASNGRHNYLIQEFKLLAR